MKKYDIVICGGGVAGLWLLNTLSGQGFSVLLIEKDTIGGVQTLGSQGMIHGGQKYLLGGNTDSNAVRIIALPTRWEACLSGNGEIDLRDVHVFAEQQIMWPAGGWLARVALKVATYRIRARMRKLRSVEYPGVFASDSSFKGPVYALPEKVLDMNSLISVLSEPYIDRIRKGSLSAIDRNGHMTISGIPVEAQLVISVAGLGNEDTLSLLGVKEECSQRRPLRQVMVKSMPYPLYGHGVEQKTSPRVTITSHPILSGGYVWYLGGTIATHSTLLTDDEAIEFAKKEMRLLFKHINWSTKEWSTWYGVRAEARNPNGNLPEGPVIQEYGNVLVAWPTKFTFTPLLSDQVLALVRERKIQPKYFDAPLEFPEPKIRTLPWEHTAWVH